MKMSAWHARAAMRAETGGRTVKAIGDMPAKMASPPDWTYWLGLALAAQGRKDEARELYQKISNQSNFYGNLALEELGSAIDVAQGQPAYGSRTGQGGGDARASSAPWRYSIPNCARGRARMGLEPARPERPGTAGGGGLSPRHLGSRHQHVRPHGWRNTTFATLSGAVSRAGNRKSVRGLSLDPSCVWPDASGAALS